MIGGLQKTVSRLAIVAVAGAISTTGVMAADLGGNCCSDLEERIAELEATTVRKGNRRVSLTVSGHVHEAIVFFDVDGANGAAHNNESNVYIGTHNSSRSRFRFRGDATINSDWSAGFYMEFGVRANHLGSVSQNESVDTRGIDIRHEALFIKSKRLGTVWLGWSSAAADGITEICLGCGLGNGPDWSDDSGAYLARVGTFSGSATGAGAFVGEGDRREVIRYITPTFGGFALSTSWGQDDYWDVALRFAREFRQIRVGFGVAYMKDTSGNTPTANNNFFAISKGCTNVTASSDEDCESVGMSGSMMHVPTGLYIAAAYGMMHDNNAAAGVGDTDHAWHITGGINTKWNALGKTNIWGMYTHNEREIGQISELDVYGVGINQKIDAAAMEMYLWYKHFESELAGADNGEMDLITLGARIRF